MALAGPRDARLPLPVVPPVLFAGPCWRRVRGPGSRANQPPRSEVRLWRRQSGGKAASRDAGRADECNTKLQCNSTLRLSTMYRRKRPGDSWAAACAVRCPLQTQNFPAGSIQRSAGAGAGKFFASSAIPLAIFTLNKCAAVAPHIHPNAAETLFVLQGERRGESLKMRIQSCLRSTNLAAMRRLRGASALGTRTQPVYMKPGEGQPALGCQACPSARLPPQSSPAAACLCADVPLLACAGRRQNSHPPVPWRGGRE